MRNSLLESTPENKKSCIHSIKQSIIDNSQSFYNTINTYTQPLNHWYQDTITPYFTEHEDDIQQELSRNKKKRVYDFIMKSLAY